MLNCVIIAQPQVFKVAYTRERECVDVDVCPKTREQPGRDTSNTGVALSWCRERCGVGGAPYVPYRTASSGSSTLEHWYSSKYNIQQWHPCLGCCCRVKDPRYSAMMMMTQYHSPEKACGSRGKQKQHPHKRSPILQQRGVECRNRGTAHAPHAFTHKVLLTDTGQVARGLAY